MSGGVKETLNRCTKFALKMNESTDATELAVFYIFMLHIRPYKAVRMMVFEDHLKPTEYGMKYFWML